MRPEWLLVLCAAAVLLATARHQLPPPAPPAAEAAALEAGSAELARLDAQIAELRFETEHRRAAVDQAKAAVGQQRRRAQVVEEGRAQWEGYAKAPAEEVQAERRLSLESPGVRCVSLQQQHGVQPGVSWGSLPPAQRQEWMSLRCETYVSQMPGPGGGGGSSSSSSSGVTSGVPEYRGYTFWSTDFHISPIADLKDLFKPLGMHIIDKSLSGHCHLKKTCAKDLRVLTKQNGINLGKCPNQLRRDLFTSYKNDRQMQKVDAILCHHACGLCEAYMAFNKSLVVVASTRFEIGRHDPTRWKLWVQNLRAIAAHPRNVVAANNRYDAEYVKYFTGIKDVPVLPNYCAYTKTEYQPSKPQVLIGPGRGIKEVLYNALQQRARTSRHKFARIRDLYPHFEYSDLTKHPAIVLIPYQVSIMSIFEYYRMAIPMFVPSPDLLSEWQVRHRVMDERTWDGVFKRPKSKSAIGQHPDSHMPYDPNNEFDKAAIKYWIAFADFYQWPHIQQFSSWDDLLRQLDTANLKEISRNVKAYNLQMKRDLVSQWQGLFHRMFHDLPPAAQQPRAQIQDFDRSMAAMYNVKVAGACSGDTHFNPAR